MNIDCFLKRFADILMNDKNDGIFESLKLLTGGTTSARMAKLLNFAVSQMADNECYVEVGVFTGGTLCAANYVNEKKSIGIDSYDAKNLKEMSDYTPESLRDRCLHNMKSLLKNTTLIEKDFRNVAKEEIGSPVGVSFIDGKHDYEDVTKNLEWLDPLLADYAVIVFDDINYREVSKAVFDWVAARPEHYQIVGYVMPFFVNSENTSSLIERFLNNGVAVMVFHREAHPPIGFINTTS